MLARRWHQLLGQPLLHPPPPPPCPRPGHTHQDIQPQSLAEPGSAPAPRPLVAPPGQMKRGGLGVFRMAQTPMGFDGFWNLH